MTTTPADPHSCTAEQEGSHLLESSVRPLVQAGKEIIVFAHSLGATVCSGAGAGLTKAERVGEGKKGGILGLIWISCAFPKEGASQLEFLGGQWPPFCKLDRVSFAFHPTIQASPRITHTYTITGWPWTPCLRRSDQPALQRRR